MTRRCHRTVLLVAAAIGACAAAAALTGSGTTPAPPTQPAGAPQPRRAPERTARTARGPAAADSPEAVAVARAYALAARNWTAASYRRAWRRERALSAGRYRRQLQRARPSAAQLAALRTDAASSLAAIERIDRDPTVRAPAARVVVWLDERTEAAGQAVQASTRNEVLLRRRGGRWRVTGWTVLPGGSSAP